MNDTIPLDLHALADLATRYQSDPIAFFTEVLDVAPEYVWDKMSEICCSVRDHHRTAVRAGHSVSKPMDINTPILTKVGIKPIWEIKPYEDWVLTPEGQFTEVVGKSPITKKRCYEVEFEGGQTSIIREWSSAAAGGESVYVLDERI